MKKYFYLFFILGLFNTPSFAQWQFGEGAIECSNILSGGVDNSEFSIEAISGLSFNTSNNNFITDAINYDENKLNTFINLGLRPKLMFKELSIYLPISISSAIQTDEMLSSLYSVHNPSNGYFSIGIGASYRPFSKVKKHIDYNLQYIDNKDLQFVAEIIGAGFKEFHNDLWNSYGVWYSRVGIIIPNILKNKTDYPRYPEYSLSLSANLEISEIIDKEMINSLYAENKPPISYKGINIGAIAQYGYLKMNMNMGYYLAEENFDGLTGFYHNIGLQLNTAIFTSDGLHADKIW